MHDEDEATPHSHVQAAVAALYSAAEMTEGGMAVDRPGWRYVPDAYRLLGQLSELAGLPDMLEQVHESVGRELELNLIAMDAGFAGPPGHQERPTDRERRGCAGAVRVASLRQKESGAKRPSIRLTERRDVRVGDGCHFRPKCPFAMVICATRPPDFVTENVHVARCWLYGPEQSANTVGAP